MKVLKYGEGYEPKTTVCEWCKSEIEYLKIDEEDMTPYYIDFNKNTYIYPPEGDSFAILIKTIVCPVCGRPTTTSLEEQLINTPVEIPEQTQPKKRWWQK